VRESTTVRLPAYCRLVGWLQGIILPKTAEAQTPAQQPAPAPVQTPGQAPRQAGRVAPQVPGKAQGTLPAKPVTPAGRPIPKPVLRPPFPQAANSTQARPVTPPQLRTPRVEPERRDRPVLSNWAQVATAADRVQDADRRADRFLVEIHKKWAISLACVSFVIIGIVMALRFPRGGIGLVIGGGLLVFSVHYVGLTAGESLADRGFVSPWAAMWTPNIVLTVLGLIGLVRVSRESGSTRGGDFQEVMEGIRYLFRRLRGRTAASPP